MKTAVISKALVAAALGVFLMCLTGCGKTSSLEGKVLDGKGQPIPGTKVKIMQVQPIKGYEQFVTAIGSDGSFSFKELYPNSQYDIYYCLNGLCDKAITISSAPKGETLLLQNPVVVSFMLSPDGFTIRDTRSNLVWMRDPSGNSKMNWDGAMGLLSGYTFAGYKNWRLPTKDEAESFIQATGSGQFEKYGFQNIDPNNYYWTSTSFVTTAIAPDTAYCINGRGGMTRGIKYLNFGVWPVCDGHQ